MTLQKVALCMLAQSAIALLLMLSPLLTQTVRADANPQPDARTAVKAKEPEPLEMGKPVEKTLSIHEVHVYALKLEANQSVTVLLEKYAVAPVATLFAPEGEKVETFGSTASKEGTEQITFVAESAGSYRITVRTFFRQSPPGRYRISLADIHTASDREKRGRASRHCQEKSWLDRENNFLVNEVLATISRCVTAVGQRLEANYPKANELAAEADAEASYLAGRWHWGEFVSPAYQQSLVEDFRILADAAGEPDAKTASAMLSGVVEDLKIKADHCRKSNRGLGKDIDVSVTTYVSANDGDREQKGLTVYYKLGIYKYSKNPDRRIEFDSLSSPAHTKLPASYYFIWASKQGDPDPEPNKFKRIDVGGGEEKKTTYIYYRK